MAEKNNPDLTDLLDAWKKHIFATFNCHALGKIESFNKVKQTATVSVSYKTDDDKDYAPLQDVPVIVLNGGGGSLTFPIAPGDPCLLFFNDRDIDHWMVSGQVMELASPRKHSLSDAIALVGLNSYKNPIKNYDDQRIVMRKGSVAIGVGSKILFTKNYPTNSETGNGVLQDLTQAVKDLATACAAITTQVSGSAVAINNAAAMTAIANSLTGIASDIGDLFE